MPSHTVSRKQQFRAALAVAGMTQDEWAARHDYNAGHVSRVLNGRVKSPYMLELMDDFCAEYLPKLSHTRMETE
jgi:gp16 family phage-associated protein